MCRWQRSLTWIALASLAPTGCVSVESRRCELMSPHPANITSAVFIADGAGNYQLLSKALRNLVQQEGKPIDVVTHEWSHGKHRILADYLHHAHARDQGKKLAERVREYRALYPDRDVHLIGHSAGAVVVVAALEELEPGVVDRAVLLAPALSAEYDVQPALASVKQGVHVFCSPYDYVILGFATAMLGTPDHRWTAMAGRMGFREPRQHPKLFQRLWRPVDVTLGNNGGHFGAYQPEYLRTHVLPLFEPSAAFQSLTR